MAVKVLVVDADQGTRRMAESALRERGYEVLVAKDGEAGLQTWRQERPGILVVATTLPLMSGSEVVAAIRAEEGAGHVPIVMLTQSDDVAERVNVFRSGADAYLSRPIHAGELVARIRALLARFGPKDAGQPRSGRVLAFLGAKGGVGTTTLAVNSAIALHRTLHRRVVLVDACLQFGDHRIFLDLSSDQKTLVDAAAAPSIDVDLLRRVVVEHESGVDLLLSPPTPESADMVREDQVPRMLTLLKDVYDYVIVDVENRLDDATLRVLDAADTVLVVMTPDLPSIKDVRILIETTRNLRWGPEKLALVLNRATAATGINRGSVESALERKIDFSVVNDYRTAITAVNTGAPFVLAKPGAALSRSVNDFVTQVDAQGVTLRPRETAAASEVAPPVERKQGRGPGRSRPATRRARPTS